MAAKPVVTLIVFIALAAFVGYSTSNSAAQRSSRGAKKTVQAEDLGKTVQLIGRLGEPMTNVVEIEGHWEDREFTKASRLVFVVTSVAGRPLDPSVEFNRYVVSMDGKTMGDSEVAVGETWACTAIELGRFRNILARNWELFFDAPVSAPSWGKGPFVSEIILCSRTLTRKAHEK